MQAYCGLASGTSTRTAVRTRITQREDALVNATFNMPLRALASTLAIVLSLQARVRQLDSTRCGA